MPGPLEGIKVVEMGLWVAGPSAAAILADWGAEVVKIEPPEGDPFRGLFASVFGSPLAVNPPFELDNRGKRSIVL
ncbi:MAG TPA: CoA transferase, partial [Dehalococcoidia bacterium]|nr:CoA transferase [Dehalococcoidia bacterium]